MRATSCVYRQASTGASACATVFSCDPISTTPSSLTLEVTGREADSLFSHESGGHRWQRVPPTEKRGRRHTSTVTVAVLPVDVAASTAFEERELEWSAVRGSGSGGQAMQKTSNCVILKHLPSGVQVRVDDSRSQWQNRRTAMLLLDAKLRERYEVARQGQRNDDRRQQVGSGQRGDKIRTIRVQDAVVTDHVSGKKMRFAHYEKGHLEDLWA